MPPIGEVLDVFGGESHNEVLASIPLGVRYLGVHGQPRQEVCTVRPEGQYDESGAIMVMPVFPNPLQARRYTKGGVEKVPNHKALLAAAIAKATNSRVDSYGHPGVFGDGLPKEIRDAITQGDYSGYTDILAQNMHNQGVSHVSVVGFSEGGAIAPDMALSLMQYGIKVDALIMGAVANADEERGALGLVKGFMDPMSLKQMHDFHDQSPSINEAAWGRRLKTMRTLGKLANKAADVCINLIGENAKLAKRSLSPTSIAFIRGFTYGKLKRSADNKDAVLASDKLRLIMAQSPDTILSLFSGEFDSVGSPAKMIEMLEKAGLPEYLFAELPGYSHALGDNYEALIDRINSALWRLLPPDCVV